MLLYALRTSNNDTTVPIHGGAPKRNAPSFPTTWKASLSLLLIIASIILHLLNFPFPFLSSTMEVHTARPLFVPDNAGIRFIYTRVIFSQDGKIFSGHSPHKNVGSELQMDDLEDVKHIPEDAYSPLTPPGSTIAPLLPAERYYLKRPDLFSLVVSSGLPSPVLQELAVCELVRRHPHPNIATYYGQWPSHRPVFREIPIYPPGQGQPRRTKQIHVH
jgi:hypothetical protein